MSTTTNAFFRSTGAELRALAAAGNAAAMAEIARRASKPAKTVAAMRSRGMEAEAAARVAKAQVKAQAAKPAAALLRAKPEVAPKRDSLKQVRADLGGRLDRIEGTLGHLTAVIDRHFSR